MSECNGRWAAIMAGGAGTRFWPASRRAAPKPFINIVGETPLIHLTVQRMLPLVGAEGLFFVIGEHLVEATRAAVPSEVSDNQVVEPIARNTLGAVLLAMARVAAADPSGRVAILPSDHLVSKLDLYHHVMRTAYELAGKYTVCLGIAPTRPETGYGYIKEGAALPSAEGSAGLPAHHVDRFVEKPDLAKAKGFLAEGGYYWNSGMFIFAVDVFLEQIRKIDTGLAATAEELTAIFRTGNPDPDDLRRALEPLPNLNIDRAVMEKADNMAVIPSHFPWSDVGSWDSVYEERGEAENYSSGDVLLESASGNVVVSSEVGPMVAVQGVSDLIVVATGDAVLVARRGKGQDVGRLVDSLKKKGRNELL